MNGKRSTGRMTTQPKQATVFLFHILTFRDGTIELWLFFSPGLLVACTSNNSFFYSYHILPDVLYSGLH